VNEGPSVGRGRFLLVALGAGLPLGLASFRPWHVLVAFDRREPAVRLARVLRERDSARAIGREYLRSLPRGAGAGVLVDAIALDLPGGHAVLASAGDGGLRALLAERSSVDFGEGRTVRLRGWVLSETEARLCALAALVL
jgi:hypothetical protein